MDYAVTRTGSERDVVLVWLPTGSKATDAEFETGERWLDLDNAIIHAREARREGMEAWIRCDRKFVLSPEDVVAAYAQSKLKR